MSLSVKNESPEPNSMKSELLDETVMNSNETTSMHPGLQEYTRSDSPPQPYRRPRNPFILFRTWYIKQGHLKQVTSSGSELSKITGKLWKAMHEEDRKFWAEQARLEREASQGRTYAPAAARSRAQRNSRKKASMASAARYCPMSTRVPDPIDERMDDIVQLIIAGKTGEEIGGELRNRRKQSASLILSSNATSIVPLLAPVPRSARASVSLDALELQSHFSSDLTGHNSSSNSLSPEEPLRDLPETPEYSMSGYSTPHESTNSLHPETLSQWNGHSLLVNPAPDFSSNASILRDRSSSIDTESWSLAGTPKTSTVLQSHPPPAGYKAEQHLGYPQGWEYYSFPAPSHVLNYPPAGYEPLLNYTAQNLAPSPSSWHDPGFVSAYDVPGHAPASHTADLAWPSEWINDSY